VTKAPLFSTYRQGENRVTASLLAVLERIDFGLVEDLLAAATGEASLEMVRFRNQPPGDHSVPDASISASFHYLFEVKTDRGKLYADQLQRHIETFDGTARLERLVAITPDVQPPDAIAQVNDARVAWTSFASLAQAVDEVLADPARMVSEREAYLLRELQSLFEADGLLGSPDDAVIVAARDAYPAYLKYSAYICQLGRTFRPGIERLGFYTRKAIQPELPRILLHLAAIEISATSADAVAASGAAHADRLAALLRTLDADGTVWAGAEKQLFLLSEPESDKTLRLSAPVEHLPPNAWTQGQRYVSSAALARANTTADLAVSA
jgi:hypothetical protein